MLFRFGKHIGSGGFGDVCHAEVVGDDGEIAPGKYAKKQLLDRYRHDDEAVTRFQREVRILGELDHPHIVEVIGRNLSADPPWFVMPYAESNLFEEIEAGKGQDREWVHETFSAILEAMDLAHKTGLGVIHRDLKPENVLIVDGVPKVSDFGLGKRLDTNTVDQTNTHIGMGTLHYMAPEQFADAANVGPAADVYALGKILGQMLTGKRPPIGAPDPKSYPAKYRAFIQRCTEEAEANRYANAGDALAAFQLTVSGTGGVKAVTGEQLDDLIKRWDGLPEEDDHEVVEQIVGHLVGRRDDEELYFKAVPRLPILLIEQIVERHGSDFDTIIRAYRDHTAGALPFEYTDVVANFYKQVYTATPDLKIRRLLLQRLVELGPTHRRWHVGEVTGAVLRDITDGAEASMAATVLREDEEYTQWLSSYVSVSSLHPEIAAVFTELET